MAYLSRYELELMKFKKLGSNVKISDKASIYNADQIEIGDNSRIDDFCVISGKVKLGRFVHIATMSLVAGGKPGIYCEDFSGLAYGVKLFAQSDDYSGKTLTNPTVSKKYKNETLSSIRLRRHVIVGANSVVFPGVDIAEGCSVGAMTVVSRSTEPWGIYVGNPAKRVKERKQDLLALEKEFLKEFDVDSI